MSRYKGLKTAAQWNKAGFKLKKNAKGEEKISNYLFHTYAIYYPESEVIPKTAKELAKEKMQRIKKRRKKEKERERKRIEKLLEDQRKQLKIEFNQRLEKAEFNIVKKLLAKAGHALYVVYIKGQYYNHCTYVGSAGLKKGDKVIVPYGSSNRKLVGVIEGPPQDLYENFPSGLKKIIRKVMLPMIILENQ